MFLNLHNRPIVKEFLAECLGTFILLTVALTAIAQRVLGGPEAGSQATVAWATGIGVTLGVYVAGGVSGGHINPAVSLTMSVLGRLPWRKLPVYMFGQYLGSFLASACVYLVYLEALDHYDGGVRLTEGEKATAGIFATYPKSYISSWAGLGDQIYATCFLLITVLAISDKRNMGPRKGLEPISLGLIVVATNMTLALNCGNAMNPARDLSPRIFTAIAGWGAEPFSFRNYNWWWVPIVGPHLGALLGAAVYQCFVGRHWSTDEDSEQTQETDKLLTPLIPPVEVVVHTGGVAISC